MAQLWYKRNFDERIGIIFLMQRLIFIEKLGNILSLSPPPEAEEGSLGGILTVADKIPL